MANWNAIEVQIPGKDLLKDVRQLLETLLVYLEVLKAILETIKAFLIDFGNPIKAIVEALMRLIVTLIEALKKSGIYAYWNIPNPLEDPNFSFVSGGFQGFKERFIGSLYDVQDINRPQPIAGASLSQYFLIVVDAQAPYQLIQMVATLIRLLRGGMHFYRPAYPPPMGLRVVPVGDAGDPILSLAGVFTKRPKALAVEWSLPTFSPSADGTFTGVTGALVNEFVPPKWILERSERPLNTELYVDPEAGDDPLTDPEAAGYVTTLVPTSMKDPRTNRVVMRKVRVVDEYGEPFTKFQRYIDVSSQALGTMLMGQLGTFRWIDTEVEYGKTYYYRVRAYTGKVAWEDKEAGLIKFSRDRILPNMNEYQSKYLEWPAAKPDHPPVMGHPSGVVKGTLFQVPEAVDIQEALFRLFLAAFSLNFHIPAPTGPYELDGNGNVRLDEDDNPISGPPFDENGDPVFPYPVEIIGRGSIDTLSGTLASFTADPVVKLLGDQGQWVPDPATGKYPDVPWIRLAVRWQAGRMANRFSGFFMESANFVVEAFVALLLAPLPEGVPPTAGLPNSTLRGVKTLKDLIYALTDAQKVQGPSGAGAAVASTLYYSVSQDQASTYGSAFSDALVRKNILRAIQYLRSLGGQGVPPNWQSISLLRDLVPWSGQFLYDLLAKIQAMLDAYKGVLDEIKAFIDLIIRKIDALEAFIQYLVDLLNYIEGMSLGFYFLDSGLLHGGAEEWVDVLNAAEGDYPRSGPSGYTAGTALAVVGPDIGAFVNALKVIFG